MSYFVLMFDQEGIAIVRPPSGQADAKQLAERYEFLRSIEPAIQRFGDAVRRAGEKYVVPSPELTADARVSRDSLGELLCSAQ